VEQAVVAMVVLLVAVDKLDLPTQVVAAAVVLVTMVAVDRVVVLVVRG
jgi:hypothetical protein